MYSKEQIYEAFKKWNAEYILDKERFDDFIKEDDNLDKYAEMQTAYLISLMDGIIPHQM